MTALKIAPLLGGGMDLQLEPDDEIKLLRRCINDLIGVVALPASASGGKPLQIVHALLDALLGMLSLDLVYIRLSQSTGEGPLETVRLARPGVIDEVCETLSACFGSDQHNWKSPLRKRIGNRDLSLVPMRLGLQPELSVIIAGSERANFPSETEKLILGVAANQVSIALQEAALRRELKRLATELEKRVAERTVELRDAHARVARSEERWRSVFENSAVGVALTDLTGRFIAANPVYQQMLGYTEAELQQLYFLDVTHPEDREHNWRLIGDLLTEKCQQFQIEKRYRRKDSTFLWVRNNVSVVPGSERAPRFLMALSEDITERKQAEEKLRRSELLLAEGQRLTSTGAFSWQLDSDQVTFSEELNRVYELDPNTSPTIDQLFSLIHPEDIPILMEKRDEIKANLAPYEHELRLRMPDGRIKYLRIVGRVIRRQDGEFESLGAIQDVTQRRLGEESLDKLRSEVAHANRVMGLGVLTASIAHEVNQPLFGIITNASTCLRMLTADPPNVEGARETARRTIRDGNRASDVITRLRTLYSQKDPSFESMDLNEATREVISLAMSELQRNSVILRLALADDLPVITGDRIQLQQVIMNLLRNAADAMRNVDDRPRDLLIRTENEDGDRVRLTVKDAGVGFESQAASRLFEAFYTTKTGGMGIGLSISRSIIEAHHGSLRGTANDGPGATFSFSIPRRGIASDEIPGRQSTRKMNAA